MNLCEKGEEPGNIDITPSTGEHHVDKLVWIITSRCNLQQPLIFLSLHGFSLTPGDDLMIS